MASLGKAYVEVVSDLRHFPADLRAKLEAATKEATKGVQFDGIENAAQKAGDEAGHKLGQEFEKTAKKEVDRAGDRTGRSLGSRILGGMRAVFLNPAMLFPGLIAAAVAASAQLAPAVGGALAAIPGLITSAVAGLGVLKLAFSGVGTAIGAVMSGDVSKLADALKTLAPAARSVIKEFAPFVPVLKAIKTEVQQAFFVQLEGSVKRLLSSLLPGLRVELRGIATALGGTFRGLLDTLASNKGNITQILQNARIAIEALAPAFRPFLQAFLTLSAHSGPFVYQLAQGLTRLASTFGDFISRVSKSGALDQFFSVALDLLRAVGGLAGHVLGIVGSLVRALSAGGGGGVVGVLGQIIATLDKFFKTAEGQAALQALANILNGVGQILLKVVGPLLPLAGQLISILGNGIVQFVQAILPGLSTYLKAFSDALQPLLPVLADVFTKLAGPVGDLISQLLTEIAKQAPLMAPVVEQLAQLAQQIIPQLVPMLQALIPLLIAWMQNMAPIYVQVGELAVQLGQALMPLLPVITDLIKAITPVLIDLLPWFTMAVKIVVLFARALSAVLVPIMDVTAWIVRLLIKAGGFSLFHPIVDLFGKLTGVVRGFWSILSRAADAIAHFLSFKDGLASMLGLGGSAGHFIGKVIPGHAEGAIVTSPHVAAVGEGGRPEVILPLTKPARAQQLAQASGLLGILRGTKAATVINIHARLGDGPVLDVIDQRVEEALGDQGDLLNRGVRAY